MISSRHNTFKILLSALLFSFSTSSFANENETFLANKIPYESSDEKYFQTIANKWQPNVINHPVSGELKAHISEMRDQSYFLGPGDVLTIYLPEISGDIDLKPGSSNISSMDVAIDPKGQVVLSPFGRFDVSGMTIQEVENMLTEMTRYYIKDPQVTVGLKLARPYMIYFTGEIRRPGSYQSNSNQYNFKSASYDNEGHYQDTGDFSRIYEPRLSIMLTQAGGVLADSDIAHIRITNAIKHKDITVNLLNVLSGDISQDVVLESNDVVYIPKSDDLLSLRPEISASTLSTDEHIVRVFGQINRSTNGAFDIKLDGRHMTLLNALSKVNVDPRVNLKKVSVLRADLKTNKFQKYTVNAESEEFNLRPNDVIIVTHLKVYEQVQDVLRLISPFAYTLGGVGAFVNSVSDR